MEAIKQFFSKFSKIQLMIAGVIITIIIILIIFFSVFKMNTSPISSKSEEVIFEVVEGDTLDSIVSRLEDEDIIKSASFAKISAKMNGTDGFIVGQFKLNKSWNSDKIISYLTVQKNVVLDEVMITFREGIWAKEIAGLIEEKIGVKADTLLALWNDDTYLKTLIEKYDFLDESILNSDYRVKLEGFLFPETYSFKKDASAEEITTIFLDHFQNEYDEIKKDVDKSDMSIHDIITLASVVQYESKSEEDMKMIAGVFYNRLNQSMPLQSSVTVCYAMYEYDSWEECEVNTDIDSPYNTYQHAGLPIGPILNPGADAINAVLQPKSHDYLYFIADINNVKNEGSGTVYYSKTHDEHQKLQNELGLTW